MIQYCLSMLRWLLGKRTIIDPPIITESAIEEEPTTTICQLCSQKEYLVTL